MKLDVSKGQLASLLGRSPRPSPDPGQDEPPGADPLPGAQIRIMDRRAWKRSPGGEETAIGNKLRGGDGYIDLKSREVFGNDGRGIAAIVEEPHLTIRQLGLEPGKSVPIHTTDAPVAIQVVRGEGVFIENGESFRIGPGKLLRIARGVSMGIANDSDEPLVILPSGHRSPKRPAGQGTRRKAGAYVNFVDFAPVKPGSMRYSWIGSAVRARCSHGNRGFISRTLLGPIEGEAAMRRSSSTNRRKPSWTCT